jgi:hypothetical protein
MQISTANEFFELLSEIWESASFQQYAIRVYQSFPRRLRAAKENNFLWTKY